MNTALAYIISKAFQLFLVLDPLGNTGIIATLINKFDKKKQKKILTRELLIALFIMIIIFFLGSPLLFYLNLTHASVTITGGIIFFLFSIHLLFPESAVVGLKRNDDDEPFIVPIATPLIVGPSSIATIILFTHDKELYKLSFIAILVAWIITSSIILVGPILISKAGKTGIQVIERFIGLICALIAVKMLLKGIGYFIASLK